MTTPTVADLFSALEAAGLLVALEAVAAREHVPLRMVLGKRRHARIARARHACAYELKDVHAMSYPDIGELLGIDHSSAMHAVRRYAQSCGDVAYLLPSVTKARARARVLSADDMAQASA